ncbi:hypothetical protein [Nocardia tengchongensis]|uniref:hypothetical protein n=1 Tax=Nocardia tengchongensis TaxID=2055889 RepID=UPI00368176F8
MIDRLTAVRCSIQWSAAAILDRTRKLWVEDIGSSSESFIARSSNDLLLRWTVTAMSRDRRTDRARAQAGDADRWRDPHRNVDFALPRFEAANRVPATVDTAASATRISTADSPLRRSGHRDSFGSIRRRAGIVDTRIMSYPMTPLTPPTAPWKSRFSGESDGLESHAKRRDDETGEVRSENSD